MVLRHLGDTFTGEAGEYIDYTFYNDVYAEFGDYLPLSGGTLSGALYVGTNEIGHSSGKGLTFDVNGNVTFDGDITVENVEPYLILKDSDSTTATNYKGYIDFQLASGVSIGSIGQVSSIANQFRLTTTGNIFSFWANGSEILTITDTKVKNRVDTVFDNDDNFKNYADSGVNYTQYAVGDSYNVTTATHLHTIDIATGGSLSVDINGTPEYTFSADGLYVGTNEIGHSAGKGMTFDVDGNVTFDSRILYDGGGTNSGAYCLSDSGTAIYSITRQDGNEVGEVSFTSYAGVGFATNVGNTATSTSYSGKIYSDSGMNYYQFDTGDWIRLNSDVIEFGIGGGVEASLSATEFDLHGNNIYDSVGEIELYTARSSSYGVNIWTRATDTTTATKRFSVTGGVDVADVQILNSNLIVGDGGTTDYTKIDNNGVVTLYGAARVIKTRTLESSELSLPTANAASRVDRGIAVALKFEDNKTQSSVAQFKLPEDLDTSVQPKIILYWSTSAQSLVCNWDVAYLFRGPNEDVTAAAEATVNALPTSSATANGLVATEFQLANLTSTDAGVLLKITRNGTEINDTLSADAYLTSAELEYTMNKLGS